MGSAAVASAEGAAHRQAEHTEQGPAERELIELGLGYGHFRHP